MNRQSTQVEHVIHVFIIDAKQYPVTIYKQFNSIQFFLFFSFKSVSSEVHAVIIDDVLTGTSTVSFII